MCRCSCPRGVHLQDHALANTAAHAGALAHVPSHGIYAQLQAIGHNAHSYSSRDNCDTWAPFVMSIFGCLFATWSAVIPKVGPPATSQAEAFKIPQCKNWALSYRFVTQYHDNIFQNTWWECLAANLLYALTFSRACVLVLESLRLRRRALLGNEVRRRII